jgi:intracellular sulfur oxidation DsrE/DsrF family protein
MSTFINTLAAFMMAVLTTTAAFAQDGLADHKLALQISDNNPQKMTTVLNVAANVTRYYESIGETVEVRIVAFNAGLHMLRQDTSPVLDRLGSFGESMPNVTFAACGNTIDAMTKKEGKATPIVEIAERVPAGVVDLMTLDENDWTIIRP